MWSDLLRINTRFSKGKAHGPTWASLSCLQRRVFRFGGSMEKKEMTEREKERRQAGRKEGKEGKGRGGKPAPHALLGGRGG